MPGTFSTAVAVAGFERGGGAGVGAGFWDRGEARAAMSSKKAAFGMADLQLWLEV
jgi:hypothetical protein